MSSGSLWYALEVTPRSEGLAARSLASAGYEYFLPKYRSWRMSSEPRSLEFPLFPGYLFCQFDLQKKRLVLAMPGVLAIAGDGRNPQPVPLPDINSLRTLVTADVPYRPHPFVDAGKRARIARGSLTGVEGFVVQARNDVKLVLSVNSLARSVSVAIDRSWLHNTPAVRSPGC